MANRGRPTKYTDDHCRDLLRRTQDTYGVQPFSIAQWLNDMGESQYALDKMREWAETHGAPLVPVRWEGLRVGKKGDEAILVTQREELAQELLRNAKAKLDASAELGWWPTIAKRLTDGSESVGAANSLKRRLARLLPAPSNS